MRGVRALRILLLGALALALVASACGGSDESSATDAAAEDDWNSILAELGVTPDQGLLELSATGGAPELQVTITVPSDGQQLTFGDGLYGVLVYSYEDGAWTRTDTADARTLNAPILDPGQSATVTIPVEEAPNYRVVVPVEGDAVWTDVS
jgi:hypothetical protein